MLKCLSVMQYEKLYKQTPRNKQKWRICVQTKIPWIPKVLGCSLVLECFTVGCSFLQLFEVEPKHCVIKTGIICQDLTNHRIGILACDRMCKTTGCLTEPEESRVLLGPKISFRPRGIWNCQATCKNDLFRVSQIPT